MKNTLTPRLFAVLALAAFAAGCNPPKYAAYESINKDFKASVPWGWQVMTDQQDNDYAQAIFIGPFDRNFYLGAPSLSVRWFRHYRAHRLVDGRLELYSGPGDFISQTLFNVYGPEYTLRSLDGQLSVRPGPVDKDGKMKLIEVIPEIVLKQSGLKAKAFIVESATPAPDSVQWGVNLENKTGKPFVVRKHAYAIVPLETGFYVLTYPATERGFDAYVDKFAGLIGSFSPLTAGPAGAKIRVPGSIPSK